MSGLFVQNRNAKKSWTVVLGAVALATSLFAGISPAKATTLDASLNEEVVMLPVMSAGKRVELETTIFKPPGVVGPYPLVVMNHGKALGNPRSQNRDRFVVLAKEFLRRGYAVAIPMRSGFSQSTGEYNDPGCNMTAHGQLQADDLQGALEALRGQPWVDANRIVVAGQSYGGLTALAFGTRHVPGVRGLINFAGGLKMHGGTCRWEASLEKAFATYGSMTALPSLWFYGENDNHFGPQLAARLYNAYVQAGGAARLIAYGAFKKDAHGMSASRDGVPIWWPETERFLRDLGMPTEPVIALNDEVRIPETQYAALDNVEALPYVRDKGREQYRAFLGKSTPRAFAVSPSGAWSWAEDGDDPVYRALADCQKHSSEPCKLYAVDNHVVWVDNQQPVTATASAPATTPATTPTTAAATATATAAAPASAAAPATSALTGP